MSYETVALTREGAVARLTLNRPEALNAIEPQMVADVGAALAECASPEIHVVVLTGAGRAFCAGGDVKSMVDSFGGDATGFMRGLVTDFHDRIVLGIRNLPKPVLASINGVAAGGGLSLALCCDLRIAADNARFTMAYANIGLSADGGSSFFLPRLVGFGRATELLMLAEPFDASKALELGLINRVVPAGELEGATMDWAQRLAAGATRAYGVVKSLLNRTFSNELSVQLDDETHGMTTLTQSADYREGITAFAEKRRPVFRGT